MPGTEQESGLIRRLASLRSELRLCDPRSLARKTGARYIDGRFQLEIWNAPVHINDADFIAKWDHSGLACDPLTQAMLAYYFYTSDGTAITGNWIAFRDLPDGQFYATAFQGYTGNGILRQFGNDIETFGIAARVVGGEPLEIGDANFRFQALPRVPVSVVCWLGDEDFPSSYRILFDQSIPHHLPTDGCAILGSMLTSKLSKAGGRGSAGRMET